MKHFHLVLDNEVYKRLKMEAFKDTTTMTELARKAIEIYLNGEYKVVYDDKNKHE